MIKDEVIVISGGAGFIGSHLVKYLEPKNNVIAFDIAPGEGVLYGDITKKACKDFIHKNSIIIHCGAIAGVDNVIRDPINCHKTIINGTMNLLEGAVEKGAKLFINLSTSEIMRNTAFNMNYYQADNGMSVSEARWAYANAKFDMETMVLRVGRSFNLPTVSLRPFNVFGPGQKTGGAIFRFINQALRNEHIELRNYGEQIRSWTYISDFIRGLTLCIENPSVLYRSLCIGNPQNTLSMYLLAKMVLQLTKSTSQIDFIEWKEPDIELRIPSIKEARELLEYEPVVDIEKGLKKTIEYYRSKI